MPVSYHRLSFLYHLHNSLKSRGNTAGAPWHRGTPDEVGTVGELLMGEEGGFITGSDFVMNGGMTAAYWCPSAARAMRTR
jgi:hypothetical protein